MLKIDTTDQHRRDAAGIGETVAVNWVMERGGRLRIVRRRWFATALEALEDARAWQEAAGEWRNTVISGTLYYDGGQDVDDLPADPEILRKLRAWLLEE